MDGERNGAIVRVGVGRHGRGVFAARPIKAGQTIELCPTLEVASSDVAGRLLDYVFESGADADKSILMLGYGMLYNHSAEPNAEYVEHDDGVVAFVATKPVAAGEEITISYGEEWWDSRDQEPD